MVMATNLVLLLILKEINLKYSLAMDFEDSF